MEIFLLAVALSMDSVALSIASGARLCENLTIKRAFYLAAIFGIFQGIMPIFGYFLGLSFASFVAEVDHFIACAILVFLGIKMIKESKESVANESCIIDLPLRDMVLGAVATSIDALAVGVTFSFDSSNIWQNSAIITLTCILLCFIACFIGKKMGERLEARALVLGGVILIALGIKIPLEHLGYI
ncbi:manganese efflux pump MntP family protein [Campylobacter sp. 19-13652]|uniref:manganese efflux pump MntP n=1 Tax=Campylobacter sp. 19-13652 TaxID=2840180 RepID=UPI001C78B317|nr:manganese efflux pump MntP family protein [Campylobacter sp. 19-13652]BCX78841.1 membrane protein [Campylobacter sp. 19-13652]